MSIRRIYRAPNWRLFAHKCDMRYCGRPTQRSYICGFGPFRFLVVL